VRGLRLCSWCALAACLAGADARAQAPSAAPPAAAAAAAGQPAPEAPAGAGQPAPGAPAAGAPQPGQQTPAAIPPEDFTYEPQGRRDPFLNLLGTGNEPGAGGIRGEGAAGLSVADFTVRGVVESRGQLIAMIQAPDAKTYLIREGDKFVDGVVRSVTPDGLIIVQEVNDPLSLVKEREIHKLLRAGQSAKE
jgi:hypothetical protein